MNCSKIEALTRLTRVFSILLSTLSPTIALASPPLQEAGPPIPSDKPPIYLLLITVGVQKTTEFVFEPGQPETIQLAIQTTKVVNQPSYLVSVSVTDEQGFAVADGIIVTLQSSTGQPAKTELTTKDGVVASQLGGKSVELTAHANQATEQITRLRQTDPITLNTDTIELTQQATQIARNKLSATNSHQLILFSNGEVWSYE